MDTSGPHPRRCRVSLKAKQEIRRKKQVLEHAVRLGNVRKTCRFFGISRSSYYVWKAAYQREGDTGLINKKPCASRHPKALAPELVDRILHLRRTYHLGPRRIVWYLARYHGRTVSDATVYRTLRRHGVHRLPSRVGRRAVHTHRYEKQVPGHHIQVDVKFLTLPGPRGQRLRRYQYTAIDDATGPGAPTLPAAHAGERDPVYRRLHPALPLPHPHGPHRPGA